MAATTIGEARLRAERGMVFRFGDIKDGETTGPQVVRKVLMSRGWREFDEEEDPEDKFDLYWKSGRFKTNEYALSISGKLNHFPKSGIICVKDSLCRIMRRCRTSYGATYDFYPQAFLLPNEYTRFVAEYTVSHGEPGAMWICKPTDSARGKGIFLFRDISELVYDAPLVVQKYISRPLLIGDYKFDLRLYVMVTSFHPLTVYLYNEGIVRFGTQPYSTDNYQNLFAHLTNASIAKQSPTYYQKKNVIGAGSKWTFAELRKYFGHKKGWDWEELWRKIRALVSLTLVTLPSVVPPASSATSFEVFGFDVVVDSEFKPWLLEVNTSPAMGCDCPVDTAVKAPLIHDTLDVLKLGEQRGKKPAPPPFTGHPASAGVGERGGVWGGEGPPPRLVGGGQTRQRPTSGSSSGSSSGRGSARREHKRQAVVPPAAAQQPRAAWGGGGGGGMGRSLSATRVRPGSGARGAGGGAPGGYLNAMERVAGPKWSASRKAELAALRAARAGEGEEERGAGDESDRERPPAPHSPTGGAGGGSGSARKVRMGSARRAHAALEAMEEAAACAPEAVGNYERVFPFNEETVRLAARLSGGGQEPVELIRLVVDEVRVHVLGKGKYSFSGSSGARLYSRGMRTGPWLRHQRGGYRTEEQPWKADLPDPDPYPIHA